MDINNYKQYFTGRNFLYLGAALSSMFMIKSIVGTISHWFATKGQSREILKVVHNNKDSNSLRHLNQHELCYYLYFKVLHCVYKKKLKEYDTLRRKNFDNLDRYIKIIESHNNEFKFIDENVLQLIYKELDLNGSDTEPSIDMAKIKKAYYSNSNIDVPRDLTIDKLTELIETLHSKAKSYISELKDQGLKEDFSEEKLQSLAETRAFDYVYQTYSIQRDEIEKALVQHNLSLIER
jgi:hypothetical protein